MKHKGATRLLSLLVAFMVIAPMVPASAERQISPRLQKVIEHAENILKYGRNIPGSKEPSLFVEALNVDTYEPAVWVHGGETHIPAQFMGQQNLMRLLFGLTELTGDPKYKQIAIDQYNYYFDHLYAVLWSL